MSGKWSAETYSENANAIIKNYLEASLTMIEDSEKTKNDLKSIYETYDTLGRFADREYQQVNYIKSGTLYIHNNNCTSWSKTLWGKLELLGVICHISTFSSKYPLFSFHFNDV